MVEPKMNPTLNFSKYPLGLRRLRQSPQIRELVKQYRVSVEQLIQPLFVVEGLKSAEPVPGLPGVFRETNRSLLASIENDLEKGVRKFLLFGVPAVKNERDFDVTFTCNQIREIRRHFGDDIFLAVDVCLCSSTTHGHCGVLSEEGNHIENSATVRELARASLAFAEAGANCIAPSDMMDGRIRAIRMELDEHGFNHSLIMSYSAKFHSKYYGPFRVAADSAPKGATKLKDRATYQIDPATPRDAYLSSLRDLNEGADILMVKPGLPYLDILSHLSQEINLPWAVYEVSGEYAAIETLAQAGLIHAPAAHLEAWTAFVRAGASMIITYGARYAQDFFKTA